MLMICGSTILAVDVPSDRWELYQPLE